MTRFDARANLNRASRERLPASMQARAGQFPVPGD